MPKFSKKSQAILAQAHPDLQRVMNEAIKTTDFSVICAYRNKTDQNRAYRQGKSKAQFGQSPHNFTPSLAVDCVPYPLDWENIAAFEAMGQAIMRAAERVGVSLEWGKYFTGLVDMPHFQLRNWKKHIPK